MAVRYRYIENLVLQAYSLLPYIDYPIDPLQVVEQMPNCKSLSYRQFAEINNCTIDEVIQICDSKSGCTHYDPKHDKYLILYNETDGYKKNYGRRRWTKGHELGHVLCGHHAMAASNSISRNGLNVENGDLETEADYFASMFLAPFPLFRAYSIHSEKDIQHVFGLSRTAADNRLRAYNKWLRHPATEWDKQLIEIYNTKWF